MSLLITKQILLKPKDNDCFPDYNFSFSLVSVMKMISFSVQLSKLNICR